MLSFPRTFPVLPAKDLTGDEQIDWLAGHHSELRYQRRIGKNRFFAACKTIRAIGAFVFEQVTNVLARQGPKQRTAPPYEP